MNENEQYRLHKRHFIRDFLVIGISVAIAFYIHSSDASGTLVKYFSGINFIPAAILMGILFSLTFTAAIATSVFILLANTTHNPYLIALLGGLGAIISNGVMYKFFKDEFVEDIEFIEPKYAKKIAHKIMHSKLFVGLIPYLAALTLASPLPDEIGVALLAGANFKYTKFFLLSFALHTLGILAIVLFGKSLI